jgi:hypothetical protein
MNEPRRGSLSDEGLKSFEQELLEEEAATRQADLRWWMGDPRGRRIAHHLLTNVAGLQDVYLGSNGSEAFRHNGRREVAAKLARLLRDICPQELVLMQAEVLTDDDRRRKLIAAKRAATNPNATR